MNTPDVPTAARPALAVFSGNVSPPRLPADALPRERLLEAIRRQAPRVLLVSAPVGFGKSTLLAQLHARALAEGRRCAWITLDERDNDVSRFMLYLREAAAELGCADLPAPDLAPASQDAWASISRQSQAVLEALARLTQPCLLVLDDFEKISEPTVLAAVQALGAQMQDGQCLAIGSRTTPSLTLATWRSQGRLQQVAAAALRFASEETHDFLRGQDRVERLAPEQCRLLHERTDGWPGVVRLAVLALEGVDDPAHWLATLSGGNEDITDYLVENVLAQQPRERREFLLRSSVMEVFDAAACDHVLERGGSQDEIRAITRANLFLNGVDAHGQWFRYHSMFREFLLRQLAQQQPQALAALRQRAARWFAGEGRFPLAMALALDSGDTDLAANILDGCALKFVRSAWLTTLERWMDALPPEAFARHHRLLRARAYTMIATHRHADALAALEALRATADAAGGWEIDVQIALLYVWMDRNHDVLALRDPMRERYGVDGEQDTLSRGIFCNVMIYSHCFSHDLAGARSWVPAAREYLEKQPEAWSSSYAICFEGMLDLIEGHGHEALQRLEQAAGRASGSGVAAAAAVRAEVLYEMDRLDEAAQLLAESLDEIKRTGTPDVLTLGLRVAARIAWQREPESMRHVSLLNELLDLAQARDLPRVKAAALLEKSQLALLDGNVEAAGSYLARGCHESLWTQTRGLRLFAQEVDDVLVASARLAVALGNGASMVAQLETAIRQAQAQGRRWRRLRLQVLLAQALAQARRRAQALSTLEEALVAARPGGYVRVFADCPWRLGELLDELKTRTRRVGADNLAHLALRVEQAGRKFHSAWPAAASEGRLTVKELSVLRLAAEGLANKRIAHEMGISDNTVETHLRHISTKLSTRNRVQAIEQARALGLL